MCHSHLVSAYLVVKIHRLVDCSIFESRSPLSYASSLVRACWLRAFASLITISTRWQETAINFIVAASFGQILGRSHQVVLLSICSHITLRSRALQKFPAFLTLGIWTLSPLFISITWNNLFAIAKLLQWDLGCASLVQILPWEHPALRSIFLYLQRLIQIGIQHIFCFIEISVCW